MATILLLCLFLLCTVDLCCIEAGTHLPTPEGWKAELAFGEDSLAASSRRSGLQQTINQSNQLQLCFVF